MRKDTQTHTHLTRARDRDAETPYKNSSTDLASDTRDLYVLGRLDSRTSLVGSLAGRVENSQHVS